MPPFLTVGGQTVPVAPDGANVEYELIGDRARAFDGTMRSARRGVKRRWQIKTAPLTAAETATLETALQATPPVSCAGDLIGATVSCDPELRSIHLMPSGAGDRRSIEFTLHEV
ncbi:MAG TPA: hypothetical protein VFQ39_02755 [Longimicrobium sp.]|nr:hypothetical protein [Longimicrobium sp.]